MAQNELVFAPLGGIGEIGMNLSIYGFGDERRRQWLIVDCGVSFASEELLPGIDLILPDIRFLIEQRKNIVGLVITHGHEDHIGALIDLWPRLKVPLYATPFTAALFEAKRLSEPGAPQIPVKVVPLGGRLNLGPFTVDFINVAHSIPESNALAIRTPAGIVLHTGDWKIDPTPVLGPPTDQAQIDRARRRGRAGAHRRFHQCGARRPLAVGIRRGADAGRTDPHRAGPRRRDDVCLPCRRASAPLPRRRAPSTAKWFWSAAPWSASPKWRARPAISTACRISAAWRATAICRPTRCWRCAPAARASRARRCRASPRTSIPRSRWPRATA